MFNNIFKWSLRNQQALPPSASENSPIMVIIFLVLFIIAIFATQFYLFFFEYTKKIQILIYF